MSGFGKELSFSAVSPPWGLAGSVTPGLWDWAYSQASSGFLAGVAFEEPEVEFPEVPSCWGLSPVFPLVSPVVSSNGESATPSPATVCSVTYPDAGTTTLRSGATPTICSIVEAPWLRASRRSHSLPVRPNALMSTFAHGSATTQESLATPRSLASHSPATTGEEPGVLGTSFASDPQLSRSRSLGATGLGR